ncbi:membrane protein [Mycobacterium antarcticum]|uniref:phage shock envelope stress response protein PspM n=1 Tax=Mycolicibacterium sp. TUM20985 TaxID=3023370 RepID=UPI00257329CE|nr:hypothetical protein [Mycolicibacterium sp. TUM20985]BDX32962.1 membrane protein [Mycolicibacterium sp. TUM20985]
MAADPRTGRPEAWRTLVQRGVDTAAEFSDVVAQRLGAAADPRAKLLRKRRWALRAGVFFTFSTGLWIVVTGVLASWDVIPAWVLPIPAAIAVGAAFLATLSWLRYRWLKRSPLPAERTSRRLPPWGSVARQPIAALTSSERGLFSLLGIMERGRMLPADELRDVVSAANQTAATLRATANEVMSMERAATASPQSRAHLTPTIRAFSAQLDGGVRQYDQMVEAAAQLVSAANSGSMSSSPMSAQRYRHELGTATDRLAGWAQAFDELGHLRGA